MRLGEMTGEHFPIRSQRSVRQNPSEWQMRTCPEDIKAMKSEYPHFQLYTWIEETQTWETEEGRPKQLRRIPESVRSDLKRGKCRVFSDLNGHDCYAKVDPAPSRPF